jgi:outer membrane protein
MNTLVPACLAACLATAVLAAPVHAQSAGDMTLGFGIGYVHPKDDNGTLAGGETEIDDSTRPIVTFEYFIKDNLGVEVLGAVPFKHDINIGGSKIGTTKQLPPTVSLNYHIPTNTAFTPFVGVGVNYTTFFEDRSSLGELDIDDSWGLAATLGVDYAINEKGAVRFDLRYIDIDSDVKLDGVKIGEVEIDPVVASVSYIIKF